MRALRGRYITFTADPDVAGPSAFHHEDDGLILIGDGTIVAAGPAHQVELPPGTPVEQVQGLICPGFVDTHVHYPQTTIIGSPGQQLLDWLTTYTFPAEQAFADPAHAAHIASFFCDELLRNGTTSASVFCTVHPGSVDALFEAASSRNMAMAAGKVMMDRHAPAALLDTAQSSYDDSKALLERWHGKGRNLYAITPRFVPTSTPEQLRAAGALKAEHPDAVVQSHLSENLDEIAWVRDLCPDASTYTEAYAQAGLLGPRSLYAHGIHLSDDEWRLLADTGTALSHCPTSNLFLGSGLFDLPSATAHRVTVGMGTDVGAGTSFSMLQTLGEAYKVAALRGAPLSALQAFHLATRGGAEALGLAHRIGSLSPGMDADLVVLDPACTPLMALRTARCESIEELLFVLMTLGDDRTVAQTWVAGRPLWRRDDQTPPA